MMSTSQEQSLANRVDILVSVYSKDNPQLLFSMCGFRRPVSCPRLGNGGEQFSLKDAAWNLANEQTNERTRHSSASPVRCATIQQPYPPSPYELRLHDFLKDSQQVEYCSNRVDDVLPQDCHPHKRTLGLPREGGEQDSDPCQDQPKELGGIGMFSMGHAPIPQSDLRWSDQTDVGVPHFRAGMTHEEDQLILNLYSHGKQGSWI